MSSLLRYKSNGLKTNCKYVACGGWETGSSPEVSWKPDRSLTAHTTINRQVHIKLSFFCHVFCPEIVLEMESH